MTTCFVNYSNWHDSLFWQGLNGSSYGNKLDFLGPFGTFNGLIDQAAEVTTISTGSTTFAVGELGATGANANPGGHTLDASTETKGISVVFDGNDTVLAGDGDDTVDAGAGDEGLDGGAGTMPGLSGRICPPPSKTPTVSGFPRIRVPAQEYRDD